MTGERRQAPVGPGIDRIRVLHVDDEPDFAELTGDFLEREDDRITVDTAANAEAALDRLEATSYDCVVSDYDMPGRNGIEFLEAVRGDYPDLPFVLFTGKGSEEVASEAVSAGVTDYLQKEGTADQYAVLANRVTHAVERYRVEEEAERTRTRLEAITGNSTDAIITIDEQGSIRFANPALEDIFGYAPSEIEGEPISTLVAEENGDGDIAELEQYAGRESAPDWSSLEFTGARADGHEIPVSISLGSFAIGGQQRLVGTIRDLTERKESKRQLRTLISNLPGVVYRARIDDEWPMEYVAGECEQLTGYPARALETGDVSWSEDIFHPEDLDPVRETVRERIAADEPFEVTYRIVAADGTTKWVWERGRTVERTTEDRTVLEGFITEITERENRKRALEHERDRLAAVFDAVPHPITEVEFEDGEPIVRQVNAAFEEVFGYPQERVTGESLDDFIVPEKYREESAALNQSATEQLSVEHEVERVTADGEWRTFLFRSSRVSEDDPTHWLGTYIDITERKTRERELQRQNERLDQFASIVSHDLRNPLNVAGAHLELAGDDCDSPHLGKIANAHQQMETLIDDLLTLARAGTEATDIQPVHLPTLAENCWHTVDGENATLVVETKRTVRADRNRVQQVIENLVRNAVKHGSSASDQEETTITVGDVEEGFYVEDDGPGIPPGEREDVFEPGYSTSRDGTGFGLSIVERIVDIHGWEIRATEGTDGGARFEITGVETV